MKKTSLMALVVALAGCASSAGAQVLGNKPTYLDSTTDSVPNADALTHRIYTPGLDDGYVPQGLANAGPLSLRQQLQALAGPEGQHRTLPGLSHRDGDGQDGGRVRHPGRHLHARGRPRLCRQRQALSGRHAPGVPHRRGEGAGIGHIGRRFQGREDHGRVARLLCHLRREGRLDRHLDQGAAQGPHVPARPAPVRRLRRPDGEGGARGGVDPGAARSAGRGVRQARQPLGLGQQRPAGASCIAWIARAMSRRSTRWSPAWRT